ncbi:hypothetical protein ADK36_12295 [Streptomyces viridochromogenes]|nr:hypothetical protein ADK36_12295 [Streptomyces viridochromogenes]
MRGGEALYALAAVEDCPDLVMATLAELAEHGIAGSADVLPMPVGPEPWSQAEARDEFERILREKFRLEDALKAALRAAAGARRERDLIRERVSEPYGCTYCGVEKRSHGRRYIGGAGMHAWERPTDEQVKDRMLARRAARFTSHTEHLATLSVARTEDLLAAEGQVAELLKERHVTNEALDDAARALREQRDRIAELDALTAAATEFRVWEPGYGLYIRRAPGAEGFAILEARRTSQGRRAWTTSGLRYTVVLSDEELFCWPDAESAVAEARRVLPGAVVREDEPDAITRQMAPSQALRDVPDGEHYAYVHHGYGKGRDLPETGGAPC